MELQALQTARKAASRLLDERSPGDALASYYVFHHAPARTDLFIHRTSDGRPDGFLVRAHTGQDLFRPLITARAGSDMVLETLLAEGMIAGRPYYLTLPEHAMQTATRHLQINGLETLRLYRLDPAKYQYQVNVMVTSSRSADGLPLCQIRSQGQVYATAGVNWQSPRYAEVYVYTEPVARGRGWGAATVSALVKLVLDEGRIPLYAVDQDNSASIRVAEKLGFVDTGLREFACAAVRMER